MTSHLISQRSTTEPSRHRRNRYKSRIVSYTPYRRPQHFGSDLVDIRVRIRLDAEIWNLNPAYHFWPWRRFALSEHNLDLFCVRYIQQTASSKNVIY